MQENLNKKSLGENDKITNKIFPFHVFIINLNRKEARYIYVKKQLDGAGIKNYRRISAIDGFNFSDDKLLEIGLTKELINRRGIAGCAASHIKLWKHIVEYKLGWTLILEDDAHFHPKFLELFYKYWEHVPLEQAKIIYLGYCTDSFIEQTPEIIIEKSVMCNQGYILSWVGAQYLLDNILPVSQPIDIAIKTHFDEKGGSYIFNGNAVVNGIRPNDYKETNSRKCMFNGIIYQNHEEQGSTIHSIETIFEH